MQEAEKQFQAFRCDKAEAGATRALAVLRETEPVRALSADEESAWLRGNEIIAACRLEAGQLDAVKAALRENLTRNPAYALSAGSSSKMRKLLDELRGKSVGIVRVESTPPGAVVMIGTRRLGVTPLEAALPPGPVKFTLRLDGFGEASLDATAAAGARQVASARLVPTGRTLVVFTRPDGVEVEVEGKSYGKTAYIPYAPEVASFLSAKGFDPATTASIELPGLAPGERIVRLRKSCFYAPPLKVGVELDAVNFGKLYLPPEELRPVRGGLKLQSQPPGGRVFIDGEEKGVTPFEAADMCGGDHVVRVSLAGHGVWHGRIEIDAGQSVDRTVPLKPALYYLGLASPDGPADAESARREFALRARLPKLQRYTAVIPSTEQLRGELAPLASILARAPPGAALADPALSELAAREEAQLVAVYLPGATPGLVLYSPAAKRVDFLPDGIPSAADGLDSDGLGGGVWLGAGFAESGEGEGIVAGPAPGVDPNLLQSGDRVTRVAGEPIRSVADLRRVLTGKSPGEIVQVYRLRGGVESGVGVPLRALLRHLPPSGGGWPAAKLAIDFFAAQSDPDPAVAGVARMNQALLALRAGKSAEALDGLLAVQLPVRRGVSRGTLDYLIGLVQWQRGEKESARASFARAATDGEATWLADDGPLVAPMARAMLASGSPPDPVPGR